MHGLVVAITGASGSVYAVRLLEVLLAAGRDVHLTISPSGAEVLRHELELDVDLDKFDAAQLLPDESQLPLERRWRTARPAGSTALPASSIFSDSNVARSQLTYHHHGDYSASIASGSFRTAGMVICPCSLGTLGALAGGHSTNLIHRAAEVHLKERRRLVVVPRETPLSSIALENMRRLAEAGAVVLPAMPGFYHHPTTIHELVDFVVGRICDQLGVEHALTARWGEL